MRRSVAVFAPGKLFVIGEYAVLSGGRALVAAVDSGIRCELEPAKRASVSAPDLGVEGPVDEFRGHPRAGLLAAAASGEDLESSDLRSRIFPLALGVHRAEQRGRGSGADVAASLHGGWLGFSWGEGGARMRPARLPEGIELTAAWSGIVRSTTDAIAQYEGAPRRDTTRGAGRFGPLLDAFWAAAEGGRRDEVLAAVSAYGEALDELAEDTRAAGAERLRELVAAAHGAGVAAKGSGACGGDSVIAVAFEAARLRAAEERWSALGAEPLGVSVDAGGLRVAA